ncbi:MAG: hypothetical protein J6S11_01270 [Bacteroidaceae bacterium]|nr:hypothetical protein [Bacteroidaceae bacterium]
MKKLLYYVLAAILLCGCGQRDKSKDSATAANAMWQSDVINPMKEALERVALASIRISGDTEGEWA